MSPRRKLFYGITLAVVATLLLLPATGWLARLQLLPFAEPRASIFTLFDMPDNYAIRDPGNDPHRVHTVLAQHPDDLQIQFAHALHASDADEQLRRLAIINQKFPERPMVIAASLRALCAMHFAVDRPEDELFLYGDTYPTQSEPGDPARLQRLITLASEGERLDPNNAFFPMMATAGYFAAGQDPAAVAAWLRASQKTDWNDYTTNEVIANGNFHRALEGSEISAATQALWYFWLDLPHLKRLRSANRRILAQAIRADQAGDAERSIALRRATRLNGEHMMRSAKYIVTAQAGYHLARQSALRPGGTTVPDDLRKKHTQLLEQGIAQYATYLTKNNHAAEAAAFAKVNHDGATLEALEKTGRKQTCFGFDAKTDAFLRIWYADALLLTGVLFSLTFGAIFKLVYRFSPRLQQGQPLQNTARWGVSTGLLLTLTAISVSGGVVTEWNDPATLYTAGGITAALVLLLPPVLLRLPPRQVGHGLLVILATVAALAGMIATSFLANRMLLLGFRQFGCFTETATHSVNTQLVANAAVLVVPLLLLALFALCGVILRVPVAAGVTRGMRATAVPLAVMLLLLWSGALVLTLRQDRLARAELDRMATIGEGQTYAEMLHQPYLQ